MIENHLKEIIKDLKIINDRLPNGNDVLQNNDYDEDDDSN